MSDYDGYVAIVGVAGRFPDAADVEALWDGLRSGAQAIRPLTDEELAAVPPAVRRNPAFVGVTAPAPDIDLFDAAFFGYSPRQAELTDPQHRLFLECAWEALENAGYDPRRCPGVVGVLGGCAFPSYLQNNLAPYRELIDEVGHLQLGIGNDRDTLTTMVSYKLGLSGPSAAVQTACSTSLVAIHLACQSLLTHECDMMLAGAAALHIPQAAGYVYEEGGLLSDDGVFRSLDARSQGRVVGNGAAVVVLKRAADAIRDGDHIYALIAGSAMNNDGVARVGFAAPGVRGQTEVMIEALACAGVAPDEIGYVEAHGTGTVLGDAVELEAVSRALVRRDRAAGPCAIGSLKANIGHLDRAAGVTGVVKTALMLRDRTIPPQINFRTPNPNLDQSKFRVVTEPTEWSSSGPRRALVNAFGLGGTNAVAVLEEPPAPQVRPAADPTAPQLLVWSARSPESLDRATERLREHLRRHPELDMGDVAFTLQTGRTTFNHRRMLVCRGREDAIAALSDIGSPRIRTAHQTRDGRPLSLVGPAVAPDASALRSLYESAPAFRAAYDRCVGALGDADAWSEPVRRRVFHYAVAAMLVSWGLRPHISGSGRVAACLDGSAPLHTLRLAETADAPVPADHVVAELATAEIQELAGRLWLDGVDIDLGRLHDHHARRRVPLPTYPFERRRFWIDPPAATDAAVARPGVDDAFYVPVWRPAPSLAIGDRLAAAGPWLIVGESTLFTHALVQRLRDAGTQVRLASAGDVADGARPRIAIANLIGATAETSVADLAAIARSLGAGPDPVRMLVLTRGAVDALGGERVSREQAAVLGLAHVIAQETCSLECRVLDLDDADVDAVLAEALDADQDVVAHRGGERRLRDYAPLGLPASPGLGLLRPHGTYLITGGLGELGLTIAEHLAARCGARLALLSHTRRQSERLRALEAAGAEVMVIEADVADVAALEQAVRAVQARFGDLHGVIHAAGLQSVDAFGPVDDLDLALARAHLHPKLVGLAALAAAVDLDRLDFCVTFSSLATILGAVGHGAYAAANAAMDGLVEELFAAGHRRVLAIDWDAWPSRGERLLLGVPEAGPRMTAADGVVALERALTAVGRHARLVHSVGALASRLDTWVGGGAGGPREPAAMDRGRERPALAVPFAAPADDVERAIAAVWQDLFGLREVGVLDDFAELGGDSFMAVRVVRGVRGALGVQVPVATFAGCRTVRELAERIKNLTHEPRRTGDQACNL